MLSLLFMFSLLQEQIYEHANPAFKLRFPSHEWTLRQDQSTGPFVVLVFAPDEDLETRCSLLRIPATALPEGLETRELQVQTQAGDLYRRGSLVEERLWGREVTRWEYGVGDGRAVEWGFMEEQEWVVLQIAAPSRAWEDEEQLRSIHALRDSFIWVGGSDTQEFVFSKTRPEQIRRVRASNAQSHSRDFSLTSHVIHATIEPKSSSLSVEDDISIRSEIDELKVVTLYTTLVRIDTVLSDTRFTWRVDKAEQADSLIIEFEEPLAKGEELHLHVELSSSRFIKQVDQDLVAEIAVLGQVTATSSYSSHIVWYPIDQLNDASVDLTFDVPSPLTAVSGGEFVESKTEDDRNIFRYIDNECIPRGLPFGFAVGDYVTDVGVSDGGLVLTSYGFRGDEKKLRQRTATLLEAAHSFENAMGVLPWKDVRFVHVQPVRKETGVSLPGMILVSDGYFPDLEGVDLSDGNLSNPSALGVLVVADELSHQWNFYSAGLPNELAEGISTFTNALFVEGRHGHEAYRKVINSCRDAWIQGASTETEFAVADPLVYSNGRYRSVVFCKTPVVLEILRTKLGDDVFFEGFRRTFQAKTYGDDGFDVLERSLANASGLDLRPFFDQWFYRGGFPVLNVGFEATEEDSGKGVQVTVVQGKGDAPYRLDLVLSVECEDGSTHSFDVSLREATHVFRWPLKSRPIRVKFDDHEQIVPARVKYSSSSKGE